MANADTKSTGEDERWMRECLRLALRGEGYVSPNPLVGAVLVRRGRVVARGYHRRFGGPHAEVECLRNFRGDPAGTTLYVNLEPCAHHGKTPPCTSVILEKGIPAVVVGMTDPNPLVKGKGIRILRRAGVRVRTDVLRGECRRFNERFSIGITRGRPFVHLKLAQSLDGFITPAAGKEIRISGKESQRRVHEWRRRYDAVLVGAGTIRADDPSLTVRGIQGRDPDVVIVDGRLSVPADARVFRTARRRRVFVVTTKAASSRRRSELEGKGVRVLALPGSAGRMRMPQILRELYRHQIGSVLVEGGADVAGQLLEAGLVDRMSLIVAPVVFGQGLRGMPAGQGLRGLRDFEIRAEVLGKDVLVSYARRPAPER